MINLRFRAQALPLNPKPEGKHNVFITDKLVSPSTINRHFMAVSSGDKDILQGLSLGYGYFSGGFSEIQKDFLAPDFYLKFFFFVSFFYSIKEYCY